MSVIKAFAIGDDFEFEALAAYEPYVDFFLFDTKGKEYGGNGITFDWSVLDKYHYQKPFFLSGGIGIEHIPALKALSHLPIQALDVNSKFEISPANKNIEMLAAFKTQLNDQILT